MYKIAGRFSEAARRAAAEQEYHAAAVGPVTTYRGEERCPLAIMLIVDNRTAMEHPTAVAMLIPTAEDVATMLNDGRWTANEDAQWMSDQDAAKDFICTTVVDGEVVDMYEALGVRRG